MKTYNQESSSEHPLSNASLQDLQEGPKEAGYPPYLSIKGLAKKGILTEGGIRHLIWSNPDFNAKVVRRLGKKILIKVEAFYQFIESQK